MSERVTVDRKEFEAFLSDNQALLERSQKLIEKIDALDKIVKQLRDELKTSKEKLDSLEATVNTSKSQSDESLRKARETMARLAKETEKRISNPEQQCGCAVKIKLQIVLAPQGASPPSDNADRSHTADSRRLVFFCHDNSRCAGNVCI